MTNNQVIVISGGSSGLGKALAAELNKDHTVVILSNEKQPLEEVAKELGVSAHECDICDPAWCERVIEEIVKEHGKIDVLINNAGIYLHQKIEETDPDAFKKLMDVNVNGTFALTSAAVPYMKKQQSGTILNVVSQAGIHAKVNRSAYNTSKWALTGMTKCLAIELEPDKIRVMGFYPGKIATPLFERAGIKDVSFDNALPVEAAAKAAAFMLSFDYPILIPELGIKHIDNH